MKKRVFSMAIALMLAFSGMNLTAAPAYAAEAAETEGYVQTDETEETAGPEQAAEPEPAAETEAADELPAPEETAETEAFTEAETEIETELPAMAASPDDWSVRLDLEDGDDRLFSDEVQKVRVYTAVPAGAVEGKDYEFVLTVGVLEDEWKVLDEKDGAFALAPAEGGYEITLYGEKICELLGSYGHVSVGCGLGTGEDWLAMDMVNFDLRDAFADYDREQDRSMMIYWEGQVNSRYNVYVENAEYPDGRDFAYEVTDARVVSQQPWESGRQVLTIEKETNDDGSDWWWKYRAVGYGDAQIEVTFTNLEEKAEKYTFEVHVGRDVYGVDMWPEGGSYVTLPGKTVTLHADSWHASETDPSIDGISYVWKLQSDPVGIAVLTADPKDPKTARIEFKNIPDDWQNYWYSVRVEVIIYDGTDAATGQAIERARTSRWVNIADDYMEVWPVELDPVPRAGEEKTVTAEFRHYTAGNDSDYELMDNVLFRWYYDERAVEVRDSAGKIVGNNDAQGNYIDSKASYGTQCTFTVRRLENWDTDVWFEAIWVDENGERRADGKRFEFWHEDYDIHFEFEDDRLYSDGDKTILLNMENLDSDNCQIGTLELGVWDHDNFIPIRDDCYDIADVSKGKEITLHGSKIYDAISGYNDDRLFIRATVVDAGSHAQLAETDCELHVREARIDYDREWDRGMLMNWTGHIDGNYHVYVENTEYPDGMDLEYKVTGVRIVSQHPEGGGKEVLKLEKKTGEEGEYWWDYRAVGYGDAQLKVTFLNLKGTSESYTFNVYVSTDVYSVDLQAENGSDKTLPGKTITLHADARHESEIDDSTDGITYKWEVEDDPEGFAVLTVDPKDPKTARLVFKGIPKDWQNYWYGVNIRVTIYDGIDEKTGKAIERSSTDRRMFVSDNYTEIWPAELDPMPGPGEETRITAEVRHYYTGGSSDYELIKNVHFRWYYDDRALEILDAKGKKVGNNDAGGNYIDSQASFGTQCSFTIRRTMNWDTKISLRADWEDDGDYREEGRDYDLWHMDYDIWFEQNGERTDETVVYDDYHTALKLNTDEVSVPDRTVIYEVGDWNPDADTWRSLLTPGKDYTIDESAGIVTIDGAKLKAKKLHGVNLHARILYKDQDIADAWCWMELKNACSSHTWAEAVVMEPAYGVPGLKRLVCTRCHEERTEEIPALLFTDVSDPSRYYFEPVYWAANKGITVGAGGPGKFSPDAPCTREQIVTFLWRMMGEPEPAKHEKFTDVAKGAWYDKPISWAYENGITTGLNDGTGRFGVGQSCTRAMCVTFFYRSAGKPSYSGNPKFTDVKDPKAYYYDAVRWAAVNNITVGMNDGTGRFGIDVTCSRAMIVTFLYRYAGITNK